MARVSRYNEYNYHGDPPSSPVMRGLFDHTDKIWLKALGIADPDKLTPPLAAGPTVAERLVELNLAPRPAYICEDCQFKACACTAPSTTQCGEYRVNCPCWKTGKYVWVEGCASHPRESMT